MKNQKEKHRVPLEVPMPLLHKIDEYQREMTISSRTATILELVRIALSHHEKTKE